MIYAEGWQKEYLWIYKGVLDSRQSELWSNENINLIAKIINITCVYIIICLYNYLFIYRLVGLHRPMPFSILSSISKVTIARVVYKAAGVNRLLIVTDVSLGSLQLWLDASDCNATGVQPSNGSTLATWKDKSGLSHNATAASGGSTTATTILWNNNTFNNGYPSFYFDGTKYLYGNCSIKASQSTVLVVADISSATNPSTQLIGFSTGSTVADGNNSLYFNVNCIPPNIGMQRNTYSMSLGGIIDSTPHIAEVWFDGTNSNLTYDASTNIQQYADTATFGITYYAVGADPYTGNQTNTTLAKGHISEVIVYNTALSSTDRINIEGYLAWKWGLQSNLPMTHTYKNTAPTVVLNPWVIPSTVSVNGLPTLYYPFWTDILDYSINGITGVSDISFGGTTPPSYSKTKSYNAKAGGSLYNSNISCYARIPDAKLNTAAGGTGITVSFWFYIPTGATQNKMIWEILDKNTSSNNRVYLFYNNTGIVMIGIGNNSNTYPISTNTWYFFTLVQAAASQPQYFLNKAGQTFSLSTVANYTTFNFTSKSSHYLFGDSWVTNNYGGVQGYMNNFYYFNRVLTSAEIQALYNQ